MSDVVDSSTRSRMMAGIRGRNTRPEMLLRRGLHARGFRFRLHDRRLPGSPDIVFPSRRAVILVHGCFWHRHDCDLFRLPATRPDFWREKIEGNASRDAANLARLSGEGWRVLVVWECALKGRGRLGPTEVLGLAAKWLEEGVGNSEIRGRGEVANAPDRAD